MSTPKPYAVFITCLLCVLALSSAKHELVQEPWRAPAWTDSISSPYVVEPLTLPLGEELYAVYCRSCHGENGLATGLADGSASKVPDLNAARLEKQSNGALFWKISEGRGTMPAFEDVLAPEQRWQLVHYLRDIVKPFDEQQNPYKESSSDAGAAVVKKTADFKVDGQGSSANWEKAGWLNLSLQESVDDIPVYLQTHVKILYSETGMYFLFRSEDEKLTATIEEDFGSLFREDVVEVFLWPDTSVPIYLEYEISPLNYELVYLVPNINGKFQGWKPARYDGKNRTQHATSVQGGPKASMSPVKSWMAEVYIPYALLNPIVQAPPRPGSRWRANFYRIDYDKGYTSWTWQKTTPKKRGSLHEFRKFGTLIFE